MSDFIDRLKQERDELEERTLKLKAFIGTDSFNRLSVIQRTLLERQFGLMNDYHLILELRLLEIGRE